MKKPGLTLLAFTIISFIFGQNNLISGNLKTNFSFKSDSIQNAIRIAGSKKSVADNEFNPADVAGLKAIRDNAPSGSPLKTAWADETKIGLWSGVQWTNVQPKKVKELDLMAKVLETIDLTPFSNLEILQCSYNKLTTLNISGLKKITSIDCSNNQLSAIDISSLDSLSHLNCAANKIPFSRLPLELPISGGFYYYSSQFPFSENINALPDTTIDYSSESLIDGTPTVFKWYKDNLQIKTADQSGKYTINEDGYYYCEMSNQKFPSLTITTGLIKAGNPPMYDQNDIQALKAIRDNAPSDSPLKYEWANDLSVENWSGVYWSLKPSKRVIQLYVRNENLRTLDVSHLPALQALLCYTNKLTEINISGLTELKHFTCQNNYLTFTQLPAKLPVPGGTYTYSPQGKFGEEQTINVNEPIDFSNEAVANGTQSVFTWYKDNVKIQNTDQTGKYLPTVEGYYYCEITNSSLPNLTLTSNIIKVGSPPEFAPEDVAFLKSIRDNSPSDSPLRTKWADESNIGSWQGVTWTQYPTKQITQLDVSNNKLTTLEVNNLPMLEKINCNNNNLVLLLVKDLPKLNVLNCTNNNLDFSNLPLISSLPNVFYYYSPQNKLFAERTISLGETIDYSFEAIPVNGKQTSFKWYKGDSLLSGTDQSGKYTPTIEGFYSCSMTNPEFPNLTLTINAVNVGNASEFDTNDVEALKSIRDNAPAGSSLKNAWSDDTPIGSWSGVKWSDIKAKRVIGLSITDQQLTELDLSKLSELSSLYVNANLTTLIVTGLSKLKSMNCSNNNLSGLDLTGVINLSSLDCSKNRLSPSHLPIKLPVANGYYNYYLQQPLFEERNVPVGSTIDYSSEAIVGTQPTTFTWYRNSEKIDGTDQTGKYTVTSEGYYMCEMTNPVFSGTTFKTNLVTAGNPPEYDPVDVAVLKAIRDNAPEESPIKTKWTDDDKIGTWSGVTWSDYLSRRVIKLYVNEMQLTALDISQLRSLTELYCWNNNLTSLKTNESKKLNNLNCSGNKLMFSTLPLNPTIYAYNYNYNAQQTIDHQHSVAIGERIDYSSEAVIDGVASVYKWYKNGVLIENAPQTGIYTPTEEGFYYCEITNSEFKNLTLTTAEITVGNPEIYSSQDMAALKAIRDDATDDSPLKSQWSDSINVTSWPGVTWSTHKPYSVTGLDIQNKMLTSLDVHLLSRLSTLNCAHNQLETLDLSELSELRYITCSYNNLVTINIKGQNNQAQLYCYYNKLAFSKLPQVSNVDVYVNPQNPLFEEKTITPGETIDFSSEANINGTATVFTWYRNNIRIDGTDQSGKYTPTFDGYYTCSMTNSKFPNVRLTTSPILLGSGEKFDSQDIAVLKQIRDNAPDDSPLKALWANDSLVGDWTGVFWSTEIPSKVIALSINDKKLKELNVTQLSALQGLDCYNNSLSTLNITNLNNLTGVNCSNNKLSSIDVTGSANISRLNCNNNSIPLSKLPLPDQIKASGYNYSYSPQNKIFEADSIAAGTTIDYSSEALIDGSPTTFVWYYGNFKISGTDNSGKYTPTKDGYYYCIMSNPVFPNFNETTNSIKVGEPVAFDYQDIAILKSIRDNAPEDSPLKTLWADETKIGSWSGVTWSSIPTKRVMMLNVSNKKLTSLNVTGLQYLQELNCSNNNLQSIDLTGTNINYFYCYNNIIPLSELPLSLPSKSSYIIYQYSPQNPIFEKRSIAIGETIDFSSQALIDGTSTVFKWYRNGILIENTDQSGKFTPNEEGLYYCEIGNPKFSGLTEKTNEITVGNPPEFDPQDIAALKAIRDNAPDNSPLKTKWATDSLIDSWDGVTWSSSSPKKVRVLDVSYDQLKILDVTSLTYLEQLNCSNNELNTLDLSSLSRLKTLNCSLNQLPFSQLPLRLPVSGGSYIYYPQQKVFEVQELDLGATIDFSSEVLFDGVSTVFTWYRNNVKVEDANQSGKYTPTLESYYYCVLTNSKFPKLTLTTNPVKVGGPPEFDPIDLAALKRIRDNAPLDSKIKEYWANESDIGSWQGVTWTDMPTKKVTALNLDFYSLTSLDVSSFTLLKGFSCRGNQLTSLDLSGDSELSYVDCSDNSLTSINISGQTKLSSLYCYNNKLLFSKLPLKLPVSGGSFYYSPQTYPQDDQNVDVGTTLDYSSEATIAETNTSYTWYRNGTKIDGTDNTGKYIIPDEGYYYCEMTNSKFPDLKITSNLAKAGNPPEYNPQDVAVLKAIRDNVPADSPLRKYWTDENDMKYWMGVVWSNYLPRRVIGLSVANWKLTTLDVRQLTVLQTLNCNNNQLTQLEVSGLPELVSLSCANNLLTAIDVSNLPKLTSLNCGYNKIPFSKLPYHFSQNYCYYTYYHQDAFSEGNTIAVGETIDYSSEALVNGKTTSFTWYKNDVKIDGTDNSGKLTPDSEGFYYCVMTNPTFSGLTITTGKTKVGSFVVYDPQDIEALKAIRDNSRLNSPLHDEWSEDKPIKDWTRIIWNNIFPKKVIKLDLGAASMITLDVSQLDSLTDLYCAFDSITNINIAGLSKLTNLNCQNNLLASIDVNGLNNLKNLTCNYNTLSFSNLPVQLPVSGGTYTYSPQNPLFDNQTFSPGETIDYSAESLIDGEHTTFNWFKNNLKIDSTDQSGKYTPIDEGYYNCKMTNPKFPGLTLITNSIKVGSPVDFDPTDVEILRSIRDQAPANSPLKTYWADEIPVSQWKSIIWSNIYPMKVTILGVSYMNLASLNVKGLTSLERLYCNNNNITSLDISGMASLIYVNCSRNEISDLNAEGTINLKTLICTYNNLTFSKLPTLLAMGYSGYSPQNLTGEEKIIPLGETIDFSSEATIQNTSTTFRWYKDDYPIFDADQSGKLTPEATGTYYCYMTNPIFPALYLKTNDIIVRDFSDPLLNFNSADVSVLKLIRNDAPDDSPLKTEWADLSQIGSWPGVTWNDDSLKRVIELDVSNGELTSLDVRNLGSLQKLNCSHNLIKTLKTDELQLLSYLDCSDNQLVYMAINNNPVLKDLFCNDNKIPFSGLPSAIPVSGGKFLYSPMNPLYEERSMTLGETINYSQEASIYGKSTVFTWYENGEKIANTDQSGKYQPTREGEYYCTMSNSRFPDLVQTTSKVKIYTIPEYYAGDIAALKQLRDDAPASSPLKALWANDSGFADWSGVTWSDYPPKRVKILQLSREGLQTLDVTAFSELEQLYCDNNQLTSLNISGLLNLSYLSCAYNQLTVLDISGLLKILNLFCQNNKLSFSQLPLSLPVKGGNYQYWPQQSIFDERTIDVGATIDFSSETNIDGTLTVFDWYRNNEIIEEGDQTGKLVTSTTGYYQCKMTNTKFPGLTLTTNLIYAGNANEFNADDVAALKAIRDQAPSGSPIKTHWANDSQLQSWKGVTWSEVSPKRVIALDLSWMSLNSLDVTKLNWLVQLNCGNNSLASLKISGLPNLKQVDCQNNQLSSLDLSGLSILDELNCTDNNFSFNTLPSLQQVAIGNYFYAPQKTFDNARTIKPGETIDYSSLANVNGQPTTFTWYKDNFQINGTDQTGKYTPTTDGTYYCKMTNSGFPKLTLISGEITVITLPVYDQTDVETLISIRNSAQDNSLLKTEWADLSQIGNWTGLGWTGNNPRKVTKLDVTSKSLKSLDVTRLTRLEELYCSLNQLTTLKLAGLQNLQIITCDNNLLSTLDLTNLPRLERLTCMNNKLPFSQLPKKEQFAQNQFMYNPQKLLYDEQAIDFGETIDYSSEALIYGVSTVFTWFKDQVKIENTDQSGKYTPIEDGLYTCTMTNASFPGLTLTTSSVRLGSLEFDPANIQALVSIRNNAPEDSPLKTEWADVTQVGSWKGVSWNDIYPKKVKKLNVQATSLTTLDVTKLTGLEELYCGNNELDTLQISGLAKLQGLDCSHNDLTEIDFTGVSNLSAFFCYNNRFVFSRLPVQMPLSGGIYQYSPQDSVFNEKAIYTGDTIDYSLEADIAGIHTIFTWYQDGNRIQGTDQSGKLIPVSAGTYCCAMTNDNFKGLRLLTNKITVENSTFDFQNLNALIAIRDNAPANSPLKTEWADNAKASSWKGVTWSESTPRKVVQLDLEQENLQTLDVTALDSLVRLNCDSNQLTSLNIKGLLYLQSLNCSNNRFRFSNLPPELPAAGINYQYAPQGLAFDQKTIYTGDTIDYSHEALIEGVSTTFTWYRDSVKMEGTDQSGKLVPDTTGQYYCTMKNLKFPDLTLSTQIVRVEKFVEYDMSDISALIKIRDNAPETSQLKTEWADVSNVASWAGVTWSESYPKKVKILDVSSSKLTSLDVSGLSALEELHCAANQIETLDLSNLTNLKWLFCQNNQLTSLDLTNLPNLVILWCSNNKISFSQLPAIQLFPEDSYNYTPQNLLYKPATIKKGDTIDFSSEALIDGISTTFIWYRDSVKIEGADQSGKYIPEQAGKYHCTMTNTKFPGLTLSTNLITVDPLKVGVDIEKFAPLAVYPNPTTGVIFLEFPKIPERGIRISVLDITGRQILFKDAQVQTEQINLSHRTSGIYFIKISKSNSAKTYKIKLK